MGFFDEFFEPIKEMKDITSQVKEELTSSVSQIVSDVTQVKTEGEETISGIATELKSAMNIDEQPPRNS